MSFELDFYTSHCQFYIYDKNAPGDTASSNFWSDEAYTDRLAIEDGILGVGTECYGPVKGDLDILLSAPSNLNFDDYDHVVEAGLDVKSGIIQILNCPSSEVIIEYKVSPGIYRARVYSSNLASVDGDEGDDFYKIEIWPGNSMERKVLKRY